MDNPTFHLESIVKDKNELQDFDGPLSLILMLLSKNKIEIRDIKIADILDQYLEYLDRMERMDLEITSEFVQMASHLLYIKTKTLLAGEEEVSELEELMTSLEQLKCKDIYTAVQKITPELKSASEKGLLYYTKLSELYSACRSRSEIVATFMSILELCSMGSVELSGDESDYTLSFTGGNVNEILDRIVE